MATSRSTSSSRDQDALEAYDYDLPADRIAQVPAERREGSRLLVLDRKTGAIELSTFAAIPLYFHAGDLLVLNDARVFPARFRFRRPGGGEAEMLLLEPIGREDPAPEPPALDLELPTPAPEPPPRALEIPTPAPPGDPPAWEALLRPARWARRRLGAAIAVAPLQAPGSAVPLFEAEVLEDRGEGRFAVRLLQAGRRLSNAEVIRLCEEAGEVPLPPYIQRVPNDPRREIDRARYQTVFARPPVAVAAPTAGLHFTEELIEELRGQGVEVAAVTHQVGIGTFLPLRGPGLRAAALHAEESTIEASAARQILAARRDRRRIVACGTTAVRALESFALAGAPVPYRARTELFIKPGHRFQLVDALITNFHLPRSSLLVLVSAFAGRERILEAYEKASLEGFRFYSYGDAMLIR